MRRRTILLLPFSGLALFACSNSEADMNDKSSADIAMLAKFIVVNPKPEAVEWSVIEEDVGSGLGPTDSVVVALLTYSSGDFETVEKSLVGAGSAAGGLMRKVPKWLPEFVIAKSVRAADGAIDFGSGAASAQPFASPPYGEGFAVRFAAERKVLVYLYSM